MGVRFRRDTAVFDEEALKRLAYLAYRGRSLTIGSARVRRLLQTGGRLGLTTSDSVTLATETLREIDELGEFAPAMEAVLDSFDSGRLQTGIREPLNQYVDRSAVAALAVAACEQCRPDIPVRTATEPEPAPAPAAVPVEAAAVRRPSTEGSSSASVQIDNADHWPERTPDGFPQMTLDLVAWWPGLDAWDPLRLTASVTQSLARTGENLTVLIEQPGDQRPARVNAVWLVRRSELPQSIPVYELRAVLRDGGETDAHHFRFLIASDSEWCAELHDYMATRWISRGTPPTGPAEFDEPFGLNPPELSGLRSR